MGGERGPSGTAATGAVFVLAACAFLLNESGPRTAECWNRVKPAVLNIDRGDAASSQCGRIWSASAPTVIFAEGGKTLFSQIHGGREGGWGWSWEILQRFSLPFVSGSGFSQWNVC